VSGNKAGGAHEDDQDREDRGDSNKTSDEKKPGKPQKDDQKDDKGEEKPHSHWPLIIAGIVIVIALIAGLIYWLATRNEVTTDDAYTDGRAVSIAANVSGYVTQLNVDDNTFVHAGDLLLTIDPREDAAALQQAQSNLTLAQSQLASAQVDLQETVVRAPAQLHQAQAQLAQAEAQAEQTRRNYIRQTTVDQRATAASDLDQATQQLRSADAQVKSAQAQVDTASLVPEMIASAQDAVQQRQAQLAQGQANLTQAQVKFSYNEIRAPQDGYITMRNVERGTYVQAGQQVFYVVTPNIWVVANFKETQLSRMRPGQRVVMTVDAYPSLTLHGHIQSIEAGSGARFTAFPAENATGNFVKIVRRVPVKIIIDSGLPPNFVGLPLGISVEPTVYIK
jgi:membrane fusion protein (multidrug efflux system)